MQRKLRDSKWWLHKPTAQAVGSKKHTFWLTSPRGRGAGGEGFERHGQPHPFTPTLSSPHDHHALHHLYPRVPHYRLKALWSEMAHDLVAKGVRTEGRAIGATGPVVW